MITRWPGTPYAEADRGKFDAWFLRNNTAIAYTDGDEVRVTDEYHPTDKGAVEEFADQYGLNITW